MSELEELARRILLRADDASRYFVAIVGPPASGKSTFSDKLLAELDRLRPGEVVLVPMDGYHYDNAVLDQLGLRHRKGAPETFDVAGFMADLERIATAAEPVAVPVFDRTLDVSRAGARFILPGHSIVLVEGNYLLLSDEPWDRLADRFDYSISLAAPEEELRKRLVERWLHYGLDHQSAMDRTDNNDLINARRVADNSTSACIEWQN